MEWNEWQVSTIFIEKISMLHVQSKINLSLTCSQNFKAVFRLQLITIFTLSKKFIITKTNIHQNFKYCYRYYKYLTLLTAHFKNQFMLRKHLWLLVIEIFIWIYKDCSMILDPHTIQTWNKWSNRSWGHDTEAVRWASLSGVELSVGSGCAPALGLYPWAWIYPRNPHVLLLKVPRCSCKWQWRSV